MPEPPSQSPPSQSPPAQSSSSQPPPAAEAAAPDAAAVLLAAPYRDAREHLDDHLLRVQRWLERHRLLFPDRYEGRLGPLPPDEGRLAALEKELAELAARIAARERATAPTGVVLPLPRLQEALGLSAQEADLLVALCAAEVEPEFQRAFERVLGERQGDVAFYAELSGGRGQDRHRLEASMHPAGVLARHGLVQLAGERAWAPRTPLLYLKVKLGPRLGAYLQGELLPPPEALPHGVRLYPGRGPLRPLEDLVLPAGLSERLGAALRALRGGQSEPEPVCLVGPRRSGRKALCAALLPDSPLTVVDAATLPRESDDFAETLRQALCEAVLQGGPLYFDSADALTQLEGPQRARLREILAAARPGLVLAVDGAVDPLQELFPRLLPMTVPMPDTLTQTATWARLLPADVVLEPSCDLEALTLHYSLPAGSIQRCVEDLVRGARVRDAGRPSIGMGEALVAVRRQLGNRFGDLAQLVSNTFRWDDLVLPEEVLQRILEVVAYARHRDQILYDWGFERKLPYGRSISVLLAGAPGTGKTMVASLLAKEMGLELFRVNVSKVVDKYIGETEKNLARIFDEARRGQVALLFDEADSLFSKRTEVKSATDRYSNLAVNYLLQAVESHDGVIILTTNHEKALDDAFRRRIRFRVTFPLPTEEDRARLWRSMLPAEALVTDDVDWLHLGRSFNMAGGSIKNSVVRAALHAASLGTAINAKLLEHGARLEAEELGNLVKNPAPVLPTEDEGER